MLKVPYRAVLHAAAVDYASYWRGETSAAQNDRVRVIAKECEGNPERVAQVREEYFSGVSRAAP